MGGAWNRRFDADARQLLSERPGDAAALMQHRDYAMSADCPEGHGSTQGAAPLPSEVPPEASNIQRFGVPQPAAATA